MADAYARSPSLVFSFPEPGNYEECTAFDGDGEEVSWPIGAADLASILEKAEAGQNGQLPGADLQCPLGRSSFDAAGRFYAGHLFLPSAIPGRRWYTRCELTSDAEMKDGRQTGGEYTCDLLLSPSAPSKTIGPSPWVPAIDLDSGFRGTDEHPPLLCELKQGTTTTINCTFGRGPRGAAVS